MSSGQHALGSHRPHDPALPPITGDPYKQEMEECVQLIMDEVHARGHTNHHTLAYQSRVGPVEWLKPYTEDTIK